MSKFKRVAVDSPDRCQGQYKYTQCPYERAFPSQYCIMHGGNSAQEKARAKETRTYRLAQWQERVNEMADDPKAKGLREEIGILRMLLERTVLLCTDASTLMMMSNKISDLVIKIEKLVSSCHRLEASTGMMLDKSAAVHLAMMIVQIIGEFVTDADAIDNISNRIVLAIVQQKTEIGVKGS